MEWYIVIWFSACQRGVSKSSLEDLSAPQPCHTKATRNGRGWQGTETGYKCDATIYILRRFMIGFWKRLKKVWNGSQFCQCRGQRTQVTSVRDRQAERDKKAELLIPSRSWQLWNFLKLSIWKLRVSKMLRKRKKDEEEREKAGLDTRYLTGHETCLSEMFPLHYVTFDIICMETLGGFAQKPRRGGTFSGTKAEVPLMQQTKNICQLSFSRTVLDQGIQKTTRSQFERRNPGV